MGTVAAAGSRCSVPHVPPPQTRPASLADVRLSWVESPQELERMMRALEDDSVTEIAVDLEHHSLHSFQGLTCLIQVRLRPV